MTHVVNQSKISCLLYCPAISPLGTVVTKRLNVGLTCSLRFASCTRTFFTPRVFCYVQSHSQNDSGDLRGVAGGDGELGCLCCKAGTSHLCDGSAHSSGCVVNGSNAMAAV